MGLETPQLTLVLGRASSISSSAPFRVKWSLGINSNREFSDTSQSRETQVETNAVEYWAMEEGLGGREIEAPSRSWQVPDQVGIDDPAQAYRK